MAMAIMHNSSSMLALGQAKKNDADLGKQLKKVASGMRINGAGDDASGYAISERMRTRIRALNQANDNVITGKNMIDLASAAIDQQVEIMRKVYTIALKATDDTYTDIDRETLQKETSQLLDESEDIAQETTYNGIQLLNKRKVFSESQWFDADAPYRLNKSPIQSLSQFANTSTGQVNPQQASYTHITLSPPNTYDPNGGFQAGAVYSSLPSSGTTVWNNNTNALDVVVTNSSTGDLEFQSGGTVTTGSASRVQYATPYTSMPAIGTMVAASSTPTFQSGTTTVSPSSLREVAAEPGSDITSYKTTGGSNTSYEIDFDALFNSGLNIPADLDGIGFSIDCSGCQQFVTIQFDADTSTTQRYEGVKSTRYPKPICYVVGVSQVTDANSLMEAVFNGITSSSGLGGGTIPSTTDTSTTIAQVHNIKLNYFANTGKLTISKNGPSMTIKNGVMGEMVTDLGYHPEQDLRIQSSDKGSQNTIINMPNTTLSILFPSSADTWAITPEDKDYPTEWSADYAKCKNETERRQKWHNECWPYPDKFVELDPSNCLRTRVQANNFLGHVEQAIKYLLQANTTLGAQSSRMEYTSGNLVTSVENTQASESVIRDANMAKEMTGYTKANVLSQSAQAMLAQANQNSSNVLSLLQ